MKKAYAILCLERRTGIERRRYVYDFHIPDQRTAKPRRNAMEGQQRDWIELNRRICRVAPEH